MKTTTIKIRNHKDTSLFEKANELGYFKEHAFEIFDYGEYFRCRYYCRREFKYNWWKNYSHRIF